jgi:hypothetical protein
MKLLPKNIAFSQPKLNRSILFNYFRAYTVLLLILCLATGFIYGIMSHSLKEEVIKANNILLQNTINSIEKEFAILDELLLLINSNSRIIKYTTFQHSHLSPAANYNAYEVLKDLATYAKGNNFIEDIYIFFDNKSIISSTYKAENKFYFKYIDNNLQFVI